MLGLDLGSNIILQQKGPMLLGEMADSRVGAGKIQDEPEVSCLTESLKSAQKNKRM